MAQIRSNVQLLRLQIQPRVRHDGDLIAVGQIALAQQRIAVVDFKADVVA